MNEKQSVFIIYDDGSSQQLLPVSIMFYERWAQGFGEKANQLKQEVMIQPAVPTEEETKKQRPPKPRKRARAKAATNENGKTAEEEPGTIQVPDAK